MFTLKKSTGIAIIIFLLIVSNLLAQNFHLQIKKADAALAGKKWGQAIDILSGMIEDDKENNNAAVHLKLAYAYLQNNQLEQALAHYQKSNSISASLDAQLGMQLTFLKEKNFSGCIQKGEQTIKQYGNNYFASIRVAYCQYLNKQYQEAYKKYIFVADSFNNDMEALLGAWYTARAINQSNNALAIYKRARRHHPKDARLKKMSNTASRNSNSKIKNLNNDFYYLTFFYDSYSFNGSSSKELSIDYGTLLTMHYSNKIFASLGFNRNETKAKSGQDDYFTKAYKSSVGFYVQNTSISMHGHYLQNNDPYSNGAFAVYSNIRHRNFWANLGTEGGYMHFPDYDQLQAGGTIGLRFLGSVHVSITGIGQMLYFTSTQLNSRNRQVQVTNYDYYRSFVYKLSFDQPIYSIGLSYRIGSLFTPVLNNGNTFVYNTENLRNGFLIFGRYSPIREISIGIHYGNDEWRDKNSNDYKNSSIGGYISYQL